MVPTAAVVPPEYSLSLLTTISNSTTWLRRLRKAHVHRTWVLLCVVALVVLAGQYHVSTSWQGLGHLVVDSSNDALGDASQCVSRSDAHDAIRVALRRMVEGHVLDEAAEETILREVAARIRVQWPPALAAVTSPPTTSLPDQDCLLPALRPANALSGLALPLPLPPVYVVTPTYRRPEQIAELTRLGQTLLLVPNVHWLVVEDSDSLSPRISALLERIGVPHQHLCAGMPEQYRKKKGPKPKGVSQRNRALEWIRANATGGSLYFADDDNTYDVNLFEEMRQTDKVSMWPVGLCTRFGISSPIVAENGTITGFYDGWTAGRKFPVDMAGFAVSVDFLRKRPKAQMPYTPGFEEDGFLKSLNPFEVKDIEVKADGCTKVLVWHTQTKTNSPSTALDSKYNNTNIAKLKRIIV